MTFNATLVGQFILVLAVVFAIVGYKLGKRKSKTPLLISFIAFVSAIIPPIGLIFLMFLVFKKDLEPAR